MLNVHYLKGDGVDDGSDGKATNEVNKIRFERKQQVHYIYIYRHHHHKYYYYYYNHSEMECNNSNQTTTTDDIIAVVLVERRYL